MEKPKTKSKINVGTFLLWIVLLAGMSAIVFLSNKIAHYESPETVAASFVLANSKGDMDLAKSFCTNHFINSSKGAAVFKWMNVEGNIGDSIAGDRESEAMNIEAKDIVRWFHAESDGDTARVWSENTEGIFYILVKSDGHWRIDDIVVEE